MNEETKCLIAAIAMLLSLPLVYWLIWVFVPWWAKRDRKKILDELEAEGHCVRRSKWEGSLHAGNEAQLFQKEEIKAG